MSKTRKPVIGGILTIVSGLLGLLGIANKPTDFTENDARMISAFSELAAVALLNSRELERSADKALSYSTSFKYIWRSVKHRPDGSKKQKRKRCP